MGTVVVERAACELAPHRRGVREVEQRGDVRIGLTVVVPEQPFVVSFEARVTVVPVEEPVIGESLVEDDLECLVRVLGLRETGGRGCVLTGVREHVRTELAGGVLRASADRNRPGTVRVDARLTAEWIVGVAIGDAVD